MKKQNIDLSACVVGERLAVFCSANDDEMQVQGYAQTDAEAQEIAEAWQKKQSARLVRT